MVTPLQKAFAKSKVLRRGMTELLAAEGIPTGRGYKRLWNGIYYDVFATMTEAKIKTMLFSWLQCYDITPAERAEILHLLRLSQTALTEQQREQLQEYLTE